MLSRLIYSFLKLIAVTLLIMAPETMSSKELDNEWREALESTIVQSKIHGVWRKGLKQFEFINDVFSNKMFPDNEAELLFKSDTLFVCYFYNYLFQEEHIHLFSIDYLKSIYYIWAHDKLNLEGDSFETSEEYYESRQNELYGLPPTKADIALENFQNAIIQWRMPLQQYVLDSYIKYFGEWCFDLFRIIRKSDSQFSIDHYNWPGTNQLMIDEKS